MNDSYERSYYEIALTNSQVLSALAVLLLCLLGSFVAGMWVAREAGAAEPVQSARAEPGAETGEAEGGEFQFFRRNGEGANDEPARASADPAPRTIAPVEVAREQNPERTPARSTPAENQQRRTPDPAPERQATAASPQPSPQPSSPQQREPSTQPVQQAAEASPVSATDLELVIQVLSSSDQAQAGKVANQLKASGYRAFLLSAQVEGRTMYRVRVGPYSDRSEAESAADKIKRQFRLNTWITSTS